VAIALLVPVPDSRSRYCSENILSSPMHVVETYGSVLHGVSQGWWYLPHYHFSFKMWVVLLLWGKSTLIVLTTPWQWDSTHILSGCGRTTLLMRTAKFVMLGGVCMGAVAYSHWQSIVCL